MIDGADIAGGQAVEAVIAGIAAAERIIPLAQAAEVNLKIISIKEANDPDELIRKDINLWHQAVEGAQSAPDWLIDRYKGEVDLKTAAGKKAFTDALLTTVRRLRDPVEQEHYLKQIAKLTDTSLEAVQAKFQTSPTVQAVLKRPKNAQVALDKTEIEYKRLQDHLLAMALMQPKARQVIKDSKTEFFTDGPQRELFKFIKANLDFKGDPKIAEQLQPIADYVKIIMLQFEELYEDLPSDDLVQQAARLKHRLVDRYVKIQKHKLAIAMQATDDDNELKSLATKADKLNELIKV